MQILPQIADGDVASLYLIWYPSGRILTESMRLDVWTVFNIPTAQIVSVNLILTGIGLLYYRRRNPVLATNPETNPTLQPQRRRPPKK